MFFRATGRIEIKGHLPVFKDGLIIVASHLFFGDPLLINLLYLPWCLFNPFRFVVLGVPAKEDYYDKGMVSYFSTLLFAR